MQHSPEAIRDRFIRAVRYVIAEQLAENYIAIAQALGTHQSNLSLIVAAKKRYPTIEMLSLACLHYHISPAYLLLGSGDVFTTHTLTPIVTQLPPSVTQPKTTKTTPKKTLSNKLVTQQKRK